ncbi:MAG: DUF2490 domain-containing protein [Saprospiraceae bacterium]|nr:DUF2490 domain-containing protein [Saprospiraceae bacterium]
MRYTLILLLTLGWVNLVSQTTINQLNIYGLRYSAQMQLTSKQGLTIELEDRRFLENNRQFQFIAPITYNYRINKNFIVAQGLATSAARPADAHSEHTIDKFELRPFQEFTVLKSFGKGFQFAGRFRTEERFFLHSIDPDPFHVDRFVLRTRFRVQISKNFDFQDKEKYLLLKIATEPQLHFGKTLTPYLFDQNQFTFSGEIPLGRLSAFELALINWVQKRPEPGVLSVRNHVRFSFIQRFSFMGKSRS